MCTGNSLIPCAGTAYLTGSLLPHLTAEEGPGFLVESSSTPLYAFLGFLSFAPRRTSVSSPWKRGRTVWFLLSLTVWLQAGHLTSLGMFFSHLNNKKSLLCVCVGVHVHGNVIVSMRVRGQAWMSVLTSILSVAVLSGPWAPEDSSALPSVLAKESWDYRQMWPHLDFYGS